MGNIAGLAVTPRPRRVDGASLGLLEAHLTIVLAALAVARHLQDATGMSIKRVVRTLKPLQQVTVRIAGHEVLAVDPPTPDAEAILAGLNLTPE